MEVLGKRDQIPHLGHMAEMAAAWIQTWRQEVVDQWPTGRLAVQAKQLRTCLETWAEAGHDPRLLAYIILGTEWLFRARQATQEDVEEQLMRIEDRLCGSLHPVLDRAQASLVVKALEFPIGRELKQRRFLISIGQWAAPTPTARRPQRRSVRPLVKRKQGPIPKVGPIVAGVMADGMYGGKPTLKRELTAGLKLTRTLFTRDVPVTEYLRWVRELEVAPAGAVASHLLSGAPINLRMALCQMWRRSFEIAMNRGGWSGFELELPREPRAVFEFAANLEAVSALYAMNWGAR